MKRIKRILVIFLGAIFFLPISVFAKDYENNTHNFKLTVPDSYYVIDEGNIDDNWAFIESYGLFPDEIKRILVKGNQIVLGLRSDEQADFKIMVTKSETTQKIWDMSYAYTSELNKLKKDVEYDKKGSIKSQDFVYDKNNSKFLMSTIKYEDGHLDIKYLTIKNGKLYEINFENNDFQDRDETTKEIESIFNTFEFTWNQPRPKLGIVQNFLTIVLIIIATGSLFLVVREAVKIKTANSLPVKSSTPKKSTKVKKKVNKKK